MLKCVLLDANIIIEAFQHGIWEKLIELCGDNTKPHKKEIARLENQKQKNELKLQVIFLQE